MRIYIVMQGTRLIGARRTRDAARSLALDTAKAAAKITDYRWHHPDTEADANGQAHARPGTTGERAQLICRASRRWTSTDITVDVTDLDD